VDPLRFVLCALAITALFLHLRVVDELKDADADRLGRPDRPLPRGLVTHAELRWAAAWLLVAAGLAVIALGGWAMAAFAAVAVFILAEDVDFGAAEAVHRNLLLYALLHSPVVPLLLLLAWTSVAAAPAAPLGWLLVLAWALGLGLEIGRKTRAPDEERAHVETYSGAIGQARAAGLAGLALTVGAGGSAGYGWSAGAPWWTIALSLFLALTLLAATVALAGRLRGSAMQTVTGAAALLLLAWPSVIALTAAGP
jgi:4-hydroxybenzoate polyprenyltransferase